MKCDCYPHSTRHNSADSVPTSNLHSEHLAQSFDGASDVCRRSNMLRKLHASPEAVMSDTLYDIIPLSFQISTSNRFEWKHIL